MSDRKFEEWLKKNGHANLPHTTPAFMPSLISLKRGIKALKTVTEIMDSAQKHKFLDSRLGRIFYQLGISADDATGAINQSNVDDFFTHTSGVISAHNADDLAAMLSTITVDDLAHHSGGIDDLLHAAGSTPLDDVLQHAHAVDAGSVHATSTVLADATHFLGATAAILGWAVTLGIMGDAFVRIIHSLQETESGSLAIAKQYYEKNNKAVAMGASLSPLSASETQAFKSLLRSLSTGGAGKILEAIADIGVSTGTTAPLGVTVAASATTGVALAAFPLFYIYGKASFKGSDSLNMMEGIPDDPTALDKRGELYLKYLDEDFFQNNSIKTVRAILGPISQKLAEMVENTGFETTHKMYKASARLSIAATKKLVEVWHAHFKDPQHQRELLFTLGQHGQALTANLDAQTYQKFIARDSITKLMDASLARMMLGPKAYAVHDVRVVVNAANFLIHEVGAMNMEDALEGAAAARLTDQERIMMEMVKESQIIENQAALEAAATQKWISKLASEKSTAGGRKAA